MKKYTLLTNLIMAATLLESGRLKNKKIIVPAVSWATTVAPFMQLGFDPILCDCDKNNFGLDINHLQELVAIPGWPLTDTNGNNK